MKVILTEEVAHLGAIGEIVGVRDGYARNYLLPRSLAVPANEGNRRELEHRQRILARKRDKVLAEAQSTASKLSKVTVSVTKQAGENDRIFGSVTAAELAALLTKEGFEISRRAISFPEEIKTVGEFPVQVQVGRDVSTAFTVKVVAAEAEAEASS